MKIGLGTVQFGSDYGISNKQGKPSPHEVENIINTAYKGGVRLIDTAPAYDSEKMIGKIIRGKSGLKIVTKTPAFSSATIGSEDLKNLEDSFNNSLLLLGQSKLYGLLIHHCDDLLKPNGRKIWDKMVELKNAGLIEKIGVSVYTSEQIDSILERYTINIIQLPINVLDQRLIINGYLAKCKKMGIEIHARSVFLQGLLLMNPDLLHPFFEPIKEHLKMYHAFINEKGLTPIEAALSFVLSLGEVAYIIVGVNSIYELNGILPSVHINAARLRGFSCFETNDNNILDPSYWNINRR